MRRLRVPVSNVEAEPIVLPQETSRYVARVHRLREGDGVVVFDPERALEADARIEIVGRDGVVLRPGPSRPASVRPVRRVTLMQSVGKGDKFDAIVRDATELGATRLVPILSERSIARPMDETRSLRWRRIAIEAARQCGRGDAPSIESPSSLLDALRRFGHGEGVLGICCDLRSSVLLGALLPSFTPEQEIVVVVGPEGGLSSQEVDACKAMGFAPVSLGPFVLRTETVCAAVLGVLLIATFGEQVPVSTIPLSVQSSSARAPFSR